MAIPAPQASGIRSIARRTCATGVEAARRLLPDDGAMVRSTDRPRKPWMRRPSAHCASHPHAGGRGDGERATGSGRREARYPPNPGRPESSGRGQAEACPTSGPKNGAVQR